MAIYLWENVHVIAGQTNNYIRGFIERWIPFSDEFDAERLTLSGFFNPSVLNHTHPTVHILWSIGNGTWDNWCNWDDDYPPAARLRMIQDFYQPSMSWRSGWTDKVIESLPFSPVPPKRPNVERPDSKMIDHKFIVRPECCADFLATFEQDVLPAAKKAGLHLELFARAVGHPTEYLAFWTIERKDAYRQWRTSRDVTNVHGILPGFAKAWTMLVDVEEHESRPTWFSPIGGTAIAPHPEEGGPMAL